MKKTLYLGFCIVLVMGVGCAITDYQIITDNDQVITQQYANVTVNTNGKAHIRSFQQAWQNGVDTWETLNFVDQKNNGDRQLTTYLNMQVFDPVGFDDYPVYHDDLYCNPDWQGCAIWTATDPPGGYDRAGVGYAAFDGRQNWHCMNGRSSKLGALVGTLRGCRGNAAPTPECNDDLELYTDGECGRASPSGLSKWLQLMNMGEPGTKAGMHGMFYYIDQNTTTIRLNGVQMPIAQTEIWVDWPGRKMWIDATNPLHAISLNAASAISGNGDIVDFEFQYNGVSLTKTFKWAADPLDIANDNY